MLKISRSTLLLRTLGQVPFCFATHRRLARVAGSDDVLLCSFAAVVQCNRINIRQDDTRFSRGAY